MQPFYMRFRTADNVLMDADASVDTRKMIGTVISELNHGFYKTPKDAVYADVPTRGMKVRLKCTCGEWDLDPNWKPIQ